MPGTIHVSVLDFKGLSVSSISIKASMGKREYQIWDKGDFSFPLTTLRDNLIITLQDAEGNQISHAGLSSKRASSISKNRKCVCKEDLSGLFRSGTGVVTTSIVEKVVWDDLFPLEGGGHIHMKLQFVLSDEERERIRTMRESALKKKQGKILNSSLMNADTTVNSTASSFRTHEVSDSRTSGVIHKESATGDNAAMRPNQLSEPHTLDKNAESNAIKQGTLQDIATPNAADRREETSSSSLLEGFRISQQPFVNKVQTKLPHPDLQASSSFGSSETVSAENKSAYARLGNDPTEKTQKHNPIEKFLTEDVKAKGAESSSTALSRDAEVSLLKKIKTSNALMSTKLQETSGKMEFPKSFEAENIKSGSPKVLDKNEKQGPVQKAPSNIRKMISAFETSMNHDQGPAIKPLGVKSHPSRVATVHLLKDQVLKGAAEKSESSSGSLENPSMSSLRRLKNSFSTGDLQRTASNIPSKGEKTSFQKDLVGFKSSQAVMQLAEGSTTKPRATGMYASLMDEFRLAQGEIIQKKNAKSPEDIKRLLDIEEVVISRRMEEERASAGNSVLSILKSAPEETIQKNMGTFNSPSTVEESTVSGGMHEEREPSEVSIIQNEVRLVSEGFNTFVKDEVRSADEEINIKEMSTTNVMRSSSLETATVSGRIIMERTRDSNGTSVVKQESKSARKETNMKAMVESGGEFTRPSTLVAGAPLGTECEQLVSREMSDEKRKSISSIKYSHPKISKDNVAYLPHESSGAWIFPDDDRHLCITAAGDKVVNSLRGGIIEEKCHQGNKTSLVPEAIRKDMVEYGTDTDAEVNNSKPDRSADDTSTGPLGQVIKIAIVVGFGLLVLLTRQKHARTTKTKETEPPEIYQLGSIKGSQLQKINIF